MKEHEGSSFAAQGGTPENHTDPPKGNADPVPMKSKVTCPLCKGSHWLSRCEVFRGNSVDERITFVRSKGLCDNCLMPGHMAMSCPKESYCQIVGCKIAHRKHSTFLHPKNDNQPKQNLQHHLRPSQTTQEMKGKMVKHEVVSQK